MAIMFAMMLFVLGVGLLGGIALITSVLIGIIREHDYPRKNGGNGTHQGSMNESWNKRWRYLLKMVRANALRCMGAMSTLGCGGMLLLFLIAVIATWRLDRSVDTSQTVTAGLFALAFLGVPTFLFAWLWRSSAKAAKAIPYVPPVREQIAALPADEVLLRGSDPPVARPDELLRAARQGTQTGAEELMRPID
jgi:hypothetical protein